MCVNFDRGIVSFRYHPMNCIESIWYRRYHVYIVMTCMFMLVLLYRHHALICTSPRYVCVKVCIDLYV